MSLALIALVLGLIFGAGLIAWLVLRSSPAARMMPEGTGARFDSSAPVITGSPIEQKLRNTIYEVEQQLLACEDEIEELCTFQQELLRDVGKPSFMLIADKPLFFHFANPLRKEDRYYYERDLNTDLGEEELQRRKTALDNYQVHVELYRSKWTFFQTLLRSHRQNLQRLEAIDEKKYQERRRKASEQRRQDVELKMDITAIHSSEILKIIDDELDYQEECLRQYSALEAQTNDQNDLQAYQAQKTKIDSIIAHIEEKDNTQKSS